jgi:hypothetical protein
MASEAILQQQVCDYLRLQYPNVMFRSDFASGMKLSIGQATKHKRLQSGKGYPDLFIIEPRGGYSGLFIELKDTPIYKRDGSLRASEHLAEQQACHDILVDKGFAACFAVGFDESVDIINNYMNL